MNQKLHFEFILRATAAMRVLSCMIFVAIASDAMSCAAQNGNQPDLTRERTYVSPWNQSSRTELENQTPLSHEVTQASFVETEFQQDSDFTPSQPVRNAPSTENPNPVGRVQSSLGQAVQFLSSQFEKIFGRSTTAGKGPDIKRMLGALSLVLGGYFWLVWLLRLLSPKSNQPLPVQVIEVLGKTPFGKGQHLQLVRLGSRLLLLLESNEGIQPIAEVTDPVEVHHLLTLCNALPGNKGSRRSKLTRTAMTEPEVHSFRIPAFNNSETSNRLSIDSNNTTLADLVRVIENATAKPQPRHRNTYEA